MLFYLKLSWAFSFITIAMTAFAYFSLLNTSTRGADPGGVALFILAPFGLLVVAWINAFIASVVAWKYGISEFAPLSSIVYGIGVLAAFGVLLFVVHSKLAENKSEELNRAIWSNNSKNVKALLSNHILLSKEEKLDSSDFVVHLDDDIPYDVVTVFLEQGPEYGYKMLSRAMEYNQYELAKFILDKKFDVNQTYGFSTPISAKIRYKRMLHLMMDAGADLNAKDEEGDTVLSALINNAAPDSKRRTFAHKRDLKEQDLLDALDKVKNQIDVRSLNRNGETVLFSAVENNMGKITEKLLELGANPNIKNNQGRTPLAYVQNAHSVRALLKHGADTRLLQASELDLLELEPSIAREMLMALREGGVVFEPKTELELAAWTDDLRGVQMHISAAAPGEERKQIFATAIRGNALKVLAWLKAHGQVSDADQETLFESAVEQGSAPVLNILKDWGEAALQREALVQIFSGPKPHQYDAMIWLLRNRFLTNSMDLNGWSWQLRAVFSPPDDVDITNFKRRLFVEKIIDPKNPVMCQRMGELLPPTGTFSIAMDSADPVYLKRLLECYSPEDIQSAVVSSYLADKVRSLDPEKVQAVLKLIDDWKPYGYRSALMPRWEEDDNSETRTKAQNIERLLKKSGLQFE